METPLFIIKSKGTAENYMNNNSDKHNESFAWDIDYDGRQADIDIHMNADGEKKHLQFQLDNEDLAEMLNYASEAQDMDERLLQDFPLYNPNPTVKESRLDLYDEPVSLARVETPKIKIKIIPAEVIRRTSRKKRPYTYHSRRRSLREKVRSPRVSSSKRLITGKLPSKRPKTMRIKLHPVE
jgi:hypothetical protein